MALKWNDPQKYLVEQAEILAGQIASEIGEGVRAQSFEPKSGRKGRVRVASAVGEGFASQSEKLVKNIEIETERESRRVVAFVGVKNVPYSVRLETTMNRPAWLPQAKKVLREFRGRARSRRRRR